MDSANGHKQKNVIWLIIAAAVMLIGLAFWIVFDRIQTMRYTVTIGDKIYSAELAETDQQRQRGLSGRDGIAADEAMLFVFDSDAQHSIWMKGMKFSIDIIWLDEGRKVIHIEHNVKPDAEPYRSYRPESPARYVIELQAGQASKVSVGDTVTLEGGV